ncbi:MAG TPA: ABC transporter substrate-binding protein [Abditibacteriaceae bacterium]|jgi:branched-chain amino acid transport system substrate-binding protein
MPHPQRAKGLFWRLGIALPLLAVALSGCKQPSGTTSGTAGGTTGAGTTGTGGTDTAAAANVDKAAPYQGDEIVLGEYGSLTGSTATFGQSTHNGIMMAVDEANTKDGVLGKKIRVVTVDDAGKTEQAATAVLKLINQNKVLAVLGEVASSRSLAAAPICQKAGVPMISPTSTNPKVTQVGDYIFRTCFIDPFQGTVMARFARQNLKATKAAVLTDVANDYSKGLTEFFIEEWKRSGGEIVAEASYSEGDKDFRAQLTRIKGTNPDVIYVPGYYTEVGNIAVQARSLGIKQVMMGGDGWDSPKLFEIGKQAVQGFYFSNHYSPQSKDPRVVAFIASYKKRYNNQTPDALAAVAYDAGRIMIDAIKRAGNTDREKIRDAIATTKSFPGVTGNISIDQERNAVKPAVVLQVKGNEAVYVSTVNP